MANEPPNKAPRLSESGRRSQAEHRARQAAALRDNLSRRKQQQRARQADFGRRGGITPRYGRDRSGLNRPAMLEAAVSIK